MKKLKLTLSKIDSTRKIKELVSNTNTKSELKLANLLQITDQLVTNILQNKVTTAILIRRSKKNTGTWHSWRLSNGYPVHGQRTHSNAVIAKKKNKI
uniref:Ribosomal protein S13 n=1 Tax=Capsaspora owczarzaki TaxID=192875 RepID=M1KFD6_9EUKA|nr:ribosomal protein S13 [Capsaspora owczarzaki]